MTWRRVAVLAALLLMLPVVRSAVAVADAHSDYVEVCTSEGVRLVPLQARPEHPR